MINAIERVIYGDVLMVINFSMDFLALYVTGRILHLKLKPRKITFAALLGALYSLVILSLNLKSFTSGILSLATAFLLTFTAYGKQNSKELLKTTSVFYIVNFALGGGVTALCNLLNMWQNKREVLVNGTFDVIYGDIPLGLLVFLGPVCGLLSMYSGRLIKKKSAQKQCVLEITLNQASLKAEGLVDSGNLLTEPISGKPVIIASFNCARKLIPIELLPLFKSKDTSCLRNSSPGIGVRIIPTSTVNSKGLLYALLPDTISVDGKSVDAYVAITPDSESFMGFPAIVPNVLI